ncbi:Ig-like domain-containing protein [Flavobacterium rhizosphaerae]|uniref:Ig-like domain-containing protein n=1 Tax=Flavobacterium rhizosphaerae TaxID=3163298 RepID=A0ABW8YYJ0_9FLAO
MLKKDFFTILFIIFLIPLLLVSCAKRGSIGGGPKDTIPPYIISSSPKNMQTNFKGDEIRINFNEYIKIKDINKQLIISPPMDYQPDIIPMGNASKFIEIKIKDTLQPNTTYSFNFGQSITDNNEGNPYSQFRFVFSTGDYIDSLSLGGSIKDAISRDTDNFVTVMLYEVDETFNDSIIYKEKPRYVTNTLDSMVTFQLQNLKEGRYRLIALKDQNNNYIFNPKIDKIGFWPETITVPNDTLYELKLFQEKLPFKASKPSQATSNRLFAGYEGSNPDDIEVSVKNGTGTEDIPSMVTNVPGKDSVQVWLPRNIAADSLQVQVRHKDSVNDFTVRFKELKDADSLKVEAAQRGNIDFRDKFTLKLSTPLVTIDTSKIALVDKDSVTLPYTYVYKAFDQRLVFDFKKQENQKYEFTLMPGALADFYGKENDTLRFNLSTRSYSDYGNLWVKLENVNRFPLILQVTTGKGDVYAEAYSTGETTLKFNNVLPNNYTLRVIYDDNGNKEWDTGSYLEKIQPEEVIYFPKEVEVHDYWDVEQPFNLGG